MALAFLPSQVSEYVQYLYQTYLTPIKEAGLLYSELGKHENRAMGYGVGILFKCNINLLAIHVTLIIFRNVELLNLSTLIRN